MDGLSVPAGSSVELTTANGLGCVRCVLPRVSVCAGSATPEFADSLDTRRLIFDDEA